MDTTDEIVELPAIGYVRSIRSDSARLEAVADRLAECGERQGFTVCTVLRDDCSDEETGQQTGFLTLMPQLRESDAEAVIVPSPAHLSLQPDVRRWMARMIQAAGAQLVVMPELAVGVVPMTTLQTPDRAS